MVDERSEGWERSVWAPVARGVGLQRPAGASDPLVTAMARGVGGWWRSHERLVDGDRYRFVVDGAVAPDPRSAWQPEGVDGWSAVVDHGRFAWHDQGWRPVPWPDAVVYELHVGAFTPAGTYAGAAERLDHLVDLGVTHVELLPLATFDGRHGWGYDGVALFAPHPAYGTPDDLKRFVDAAHGRGIGVLLDVVYNHLGPTGNHLATFGPYFTDRHHTPWGAAVNLDGWGSDEVRRFIVDNARGWLRDYHLDGLRLDAVHALVDQRARHLLEELAAAVAALADELGRELVVVAENDTNDPRLVTAREAGGFGLDAHWCDDVHHALHTVVTGEAASYYRDFPVDDDLSVLVRALRQGYVYDGRWSPSRGHTVGRPPRGPDGSLRGSQLVACLQNHDQVGNRARGERLHQVASVAAQRAAAALLLTAPFVPVLFMGEEWAASAPFPYFADHSDPHLAAAVRRGRRSEFAAFGWDADDVLDPEDAATFELARLDWDEPERGEHAAMLAWYRALLAVRRAWVDTRALVGTDVEVEVPAPRTIVVRRGPLTVAANLGGPAAVVPVPGTVVLASPDVRVVDGRASLDRWDVVIVNN